MATAVRVLVAVVFFSLALQFILDLARNYKSLPQKTACHFNAKGIADGWESPRDWAVMSVCAVVFSAALAILMLLRLDTGSGVMDIVAQIAPCLGFGIVYPAFTQILRINTGRQKRLSISRVFAWGLATPVVVFLAVMAPITLRR